ncbi:flagellar biosynthesis protein FlhB [Sphingomonas sp. NFR15]|uniref:EscU/YscU/HrcU family type III secretion system export apparatus switch protein n=1 Tax=Sphingomonas sp. NFR15 TaxID=1566282 RepID=UPI0008926780|nr:EscU/YscU/HrcU family type III secretion system export apparatus switch protein [Sphingomonas sp. NFR15]SDA36238.1 type III secretion protein U [Sphingomonas sp. NFR15]
MADKNDGGDKTEKPTAKRLRDARKKGDVAKSKDFGAALGMVVWLALFATAAGLLGGRIADFTTMTLDRAVTVPFATALPLVGWNAVTLLLGIAAMTLVPAAIAGLAAEFFQTGVILTTDKMKPTLDKMNPIEGLKKMFSMDNLVELAKTLVKALLILAIVVAVMRGSFGALGELLNAAAWSPVQSSGPQVAAQIFALSQSVTLQLIGWTTAVFLLVAFADRIYAHHTFIKKLKMSRRDIRQEHKDSEGDPLLRQQRRQMHEEYANQNAIGAAGAANVLLVNPTHLAIALDYDPGACPVPVIAAKGEGPLAAAMRARAEENGVPIVRNIGLTRTIFATGEAGAIIPEPLFDAIAEIILWAKRARAGDAPLHREDAQEFGL